MATLFIRNIDEAAVERIKRAAAARQMTLAEYLARLSQLHDIARQHADAGCDQLTIELEAIGLQTVRA